MLAWLLIICIVFFLLYSDIDITGNRIIVLGYKTKYFYISDGQSKKMFEKMKKDGMPEESLKQFITMEDRFLSLERKSVCSQISRKFEAFALSDEIKKQFGGEDVLEQVKRRTQLI